jgi:hypothetical protein
VIAALEMLSGGTDDQTDYKGILGSRFNIESEMNEPSSAR